jgi:D-alanyl-D-alanine carboxypeptidase
LPGVVVGVESDQDLVWAKGFGYTNIASAKPMQTDTRFRMASRSMLFTATSIMQLKEQNKLLLDDPVVNYLPWFKFKQVTSNAPLVTIEHLLTHNSGLPREVSSHWSNFNFPTNSEVRGWITQRQAAFSPEVRWKYSNLAYTVAGMVVEKISGMS